MDQNVHQDILRWRALELERKIQKTDITQDLDSLLEFQMMEMRYAIYLRYLDAVGRVDDVFAIPMTPPHVIGIIRSRGQQIALISLRKFFGSGTRGVIDADYALIVIARGIKFAIQAEEIIGVLQLEKNAIMPHPENFAPEQIPYVCGMTNDGLTVIDLEKLVDAEGFALI